MRVSGQFVEVVGGLFFPESYTLLYRLNMAYEMVQADAVDGCGVEKKRTPGATRQAAYRSLNVNKQKLRESLYRWRARNSGYKKKAAGYQAAWRKKNKLLADRSHSTLPSEAEI